MCVEACTLLTGHNFIDFICTIQICMRYLLADLSIDIPHGAAIALLGTL